MFSSLESNNNKKTHLSNKLEALKNINNTNSDNNPIQNSKDKFSLLNDKILSLAENKYSKNFKNIIENKIKEVKDNFKTNVDSLEQKYSILNSQMIKFNQIIEEDKINKEKNKIKNELELKELEQEIKNMLTKEREFMKSYIDDYTKKIEETIINHAQEIKEENDMIKENIENLKNYMENEINNVNNNIISENEEKINNIKNINEEMEEKFVEIKENIEEQKQKRENIEKNNESNISEILEKVKHEVNVHKTKREEFQDNVFTIIEDTCLKLAENNF